MSTAQRVSIAVLISMSYFFAGSARAQSPGASPSTAAVRKIAMRAAVSDQTLPMRAGPAPLDSGAIVCSPTPCVFPPTQASEGGALVNTSPIAVNPLNSKQLLVGSNDFNCP